MKRVLADFRINLTVSADDYEAAVQAGALFDGVNGVLFVPPRVDLIPVGEWLPFSLDGRMHNVTKSAMTTVSSRPIRPYPRPRVRRKWTGLRI